MKYRKLRVQDQIREEVSSMIQRDIKDPGIGFVTIMEVKMSEDLKVAKIFCSVYGDDETKQKTLEALKRSKGYIRFLLGKRIKLRYTPELIFVLDKTFETAMKIDEILKKESHAPED
ncbi:MAG TPA: 30S ribosome-binding factor RbfA [Syntrophorhabdaceae bacterium]|jgi:ribosome-binding factor A